MLYHARRLGTDVRGVWGWVLIIAVTSMITAAVLTYAAAFGLVSLSDGSLSLRPPHAPLSFLRGIDPTADAVQDLPSLQTQQNQLETPGIALLLRDMTSDPRIFFTLPLDATTSKLLAFPGPNPSSGNVVVGSQPAFFARQSPGAPGSASFWGTLPEVARDGAIGPIPIRQESTAVPAFTYVGGNGYRTIQREPLLWLTPNQAISLGFYFPYTPAVIAKSVTCYCDVSRLESLASDMTRAEHQAGTDRTFYAVRYAGLIGPVERSTAVANILIAIFCLSTGLIVAVFSVSAAWMFWRGRRYEYDVERRAGSTELPLQLRQQIILSMAITLPALLGFLVIDHLMQGTAPPPPWPPGGGWPIPFLCLGLQVAVGAATAVSVHRLCQPTPRRRRSYE